MDVSKKIPVKNVSLFSDGVSIVERQGSVPVKEGILYSLDFDLNDLNNVLRTIMVIDADGGAVEKIQYEISGNGFETSGDELGIEPGRAFSSIIEGSINENHHRNQERRGNYWTYFGLRNQWSYNNY